MANNKFFRRYRELEKYRLADNNPTTDLTFTQDRLEVFQALWTDPLSSTTNKTRHHHHHNGNSGPVQPLKFHGKLVRSKEYRHELRKKREDADKKRQKEFQREHLIRQREDEHKATIALAKTLKDYVENHQVIPKQVIDQSDAIRLTSKDELSLKTNHLHSISPPPSLPLAPPRGIGNVAVEHELSITKHNEDETVFPKLTYSLSTQPMKIPHTLPALATPHLKGHGKWTIEERQRMNEIYHTLQPPRRGAPQALINLYLETFTERFIVYYPFRPREMIKEKISALYRKRQFKEKGEEVYWEKLGGSS
eukprot:gene5178-5698_t